MDRRHLDRLRATRAAKQLEGVISQVAGRHTLSLRYSIDMQSRPRGDPPYKNQESVFVHGLPPSLLPLPPLANPLLIFVAELRKGNSQDSAILGDELDLSVGHALPLGFDLMAVPIAPGSPE